MDFAFLLDPRRKLLSVGYDAGLQKLHSACYDLLASESRIAAFVGIVKEDIPQESWFLLGRAHTVEAGRPVLVSWTGTMFEYLMPPIWMRSYPNTLLERSRSAAVRAQQAFATRKGVPWGISESAYFDMDEAGNYQYHAFGLSGSGGAQGREASAGDLAVLHGVGIRSGRIGSSQEPSPHSPRGLVRVVWLLRSGRFYSVGAHFTLAPLRTCKVLDGASSGHVSAFPDELSAWRHRAKLVPCRSAEFKPANCCCMKNQSRMSAPCVTRWDVSLSRKQFRSACRSVQYASGEHDVLSIED